MDRQRVIISLTWIIIFLHYLSPSCCSCSSSKTRTKIIDQSQYNNNNNNHQYHQFWNELLIARLQNGGVDEVLEEETLGRQTDLSKIMDFCLSFIFTLSPSRFYFLSISAIFWLLPIFFSVHVMWWSNKAAGSCHIVKPVFSNNSNFRATNLQRSGTRQQMWNRFWIVVERSSSYCKYQGRKKDKLHSSISIAAFASNPPEECMLEWVNRDMDRFIDFPPLALLGKYF